MRNKKILSQLLNLTDDTIIHDRFYFGSFNTGGLSPKQSVQNCHTLGCLAGELPNFTESWFFDDKGSLCYKNKRLSSSEALSDFFKLPSFIIRLMFIPLWYHQFEDTLIRIESPHANAKLSEVQDNIRKLMELVPQYFEDEK